MGKKIYLSDEIAISPKKQKELKSIALVCLDEVHVTIYFSSKEDQYLLLKKHEWVQSPYIVERVEIK